MDEAELRSLVAQIASDSDVEADEAWGRLRHLREKVVPYFLEAYSQTPRWKGRLHLVFYSIPFARECEAAVSLGIAALRDRSKQVRHRACGLLAFSLREDALPELRRLLADTDLATAEDAKYAIRSIERSNHNYFVDRDETGRVTWKVGDTTAPPVKESLWRP